MEATRLYSIALIVFFCDRYVNALWFISLLISIFHRPQSKECKPYDAIYYYQAYSIYLLDHTGGSYKGSNGCFYMMNVHAFRLYLCWLFPICPKNCLFRNAHLQGLPSMPSLSLSLWGNFVPMCSSLPFLWTPMALTACSFV